MGKEVIPKESGKLKWMCNEAFFAVKGKMPKVLREQEKYDRVMAYILGFSSGFIIASVGEYGLGLINSLGVNLPLDKVASHSLAATAFAPIIAYGIAPKYVRNFVKENPVYSSGAIGVIAGASLKALSTLLYS